MSGESVIEAEVYIGGGPRVIVQTDDGSEAFLRNGLLAVRSLEATGRKRGDRYWTTLEVEHSRGAIANGYIMVDDEAFTDLCRAWLTLRGENTVTVEVTSGVADVVKAADWLDVELVDFDA